jgi:raffinose/stachyose/melibiose transport system substrate-binding protein
MTRTHKNLLGAGAALAAMLAGLVAAQAGSLKIESWRNDDADIWN